MKVLVFGTFDGFHPGHYFFLEEAETYGDLHVVVARDETVERIKGKKAQESEEERAENIREVFPDAHVLLGDAHDYLAPVRQVQPDLIVMGYDQKLPPGVNEPDLPCPVERVDAFKPDEYKSSLLRNQQEE